MYGICMSEKYTYSDEPLKIIPKIQKKINSGKIRMQTAAYECKLRQMENFTET